MSNKTNQIEAASFRDPDGYVFYKDKRVFRAINAERADFFREVLKNKTVIQLIKDKKIIKSFEATEFAPELVIEHQKIDLFSYPYEWCTMQLFEAALLTLDVQEALLDSDLCLKDATPYNVQFINSKPIFIDFSSIEANKGRRLWFAYNQFLEMFYYPLLLKVEKNINNKKTYLVNFNGIKVDEVKDVLGTLAAFAPANIFDVGLPYLFSSKDKAAKSIAEAEMQKASELNIKIQKYAISSLKKKIIALRKKYLKTRKASNWSSYTENIHYGDKDYDYKKEIIKSSLEKLAATKVCDLGANTGDFSYIADSCGARVLSLDMDHNSVEMIFERACEQNLKITPMLADLDNPSPAIGWLNKERKSLLNRLQNNFKADTVLALALMHHLLISSRIPLEQIISFLASLTTKHLIIEYVGPDDEMFQKTLGTRENIYTDITEEHFRSLLEQRFEILETFSFENNKRKIFIGLRS